MARHVGLGWQNHRTVMLTEGLNLGIQLRIIPVRLADRGPEIIDDDGLEHALEMPECILQTADETLGGLMKYRFTVGFARMAQDDTEDITFSTFAFGGKDGRPGAEIHLRLLTRRRLHPPKRQRL